MSNGSCDIVLDGPPCISTDSVGPVPDFALVYFVSCRRCLLLLEIKLILCAFLRFKSFPSEIKNPVPFLFRFLYFSCSRVTNRDQVDHHARSDILVLIRQIFSEGLKSRPSSGRGLPSHSTPVASRKRKRRMFTHILNLKPSMTRRMRFNFFTHKRPMKLLFLQWIRHVGIRTLETKGFCLYATARIRPSTPWSTTTT